MDIGWIWIKTFNAMPTEFSKTLLWLVLLTEICLISPSSLYRNILCKGKGTNT